MNFKKFISGVSALTIAASAFAGMAVTANAALTSVDLKAQAGWCAGASSAGITADSFAAEQTATKDMLFFNNITNYKCQGIALLQFDLPTIPAGEKVTSATLTSQARTINGTRTYDIYKLTTEPDKSTYTLTSIDDATKAIDAVGGGTKLGSGSANQNSKNYTATETDVTNSVKAAVANGDATYTVAYTNVAKTGYLNAYTTTLSVTYGSDPVESITVEYRTADNTLVASKSIENVATSYAQGDEFTYTSVNYVQDEDGNYYYVANDYVTDGNVSYSAKAPNKENRQLYKKIDALAANNTLTYTVYPAADSDKIVYYKEFEDLYSRNVTGNVDRMYVSGGKGIWTTSTVDTYTADKNGTYKITLVSTGAGRGTTISVNGDETNGLLATVTQDNGAYGNSNVVTANLNAGDKIVITGHGANNATVNLDYIVVRQMSVVVDPTATAAQYGEDIPADEGYEGTDTIASVFEATVTAGTNAITSVQFTLNDGAKTTDTWSGNITSGPVVFGLIVPMAGADVNNIKAKLNGVEYTAYTK